MIRIQHRNTNLTSLAEDMKTLQVLSGKKPLAVERELLSEDQAEAQVIAEMGPGKKASAAAMKKAHKNAKRHAEADDASFDEEEDDDLDEWFDEDEDEDVDISALFDLDEDEDEDEDFDEEFDGESDLDEGMVDAMELLDVFAELDEDEVDEMDEDDFALVEEAYALMERGRAGARVGKDDPERFKAKKKSAFGGFKRHKLGVAFQPIGRLRKKLWKNLKAGGLVKNVKKNVPAIKGALAIRAISRMAGTRFTARNLAGEYGKMAIKKLAALKGMSPKKRASAAGTWLKSKGGYLSATRNKQRRNREARRNESNEEFNNLIEEFRGVLSEGLAEDHEDDNSGYYDTCESLIENFQKVGATAETLADRLVTEMRNLPESEDPREDPRFEVGSFLEGIARDAGSCLEVLIDYDEEGNPFFNEDVDHDVAFEDLQNITSDLDRALGALAEFD